LHERRSLRHGSVRKDGTVIEVSVTLSPVCDAHGQIVAVSKIAREVKARQRAKPGLGNSRPDANAMRTLRLTTNARDRPTRALTEKIDEFVRNEQRFQTLVQGVGWSAAVHPEDAPVSREMSLGTRSLAGAKILVVDDSDINREVAQMILRRQGALVATSGTGAEALERLRRDPNAFEIVLMDVQMPDMDGNEAARRIRTELQLTTLPIIALTAGALQSERERSLQAGMNDFFTKPFEPAALIAIVHRYLQRKPTTALATAAELAIDGPALFASAAPHIDPTVARSVFGDDTALFVSLLGRLLRDFGEFALPVSVDVHDVSALAHMKGQLHKLKGGTGMIGATTVHRLAGAAEAALAADPATEIVEPLLRQLAAALTALSEAAAPMLAAATVTKSAFTCPLATPIDATLAAIDRFLELLDDQDLHVMEHLSALSPSLRARFGEARFAHLQEAVNALDFELAASILRDPAARVRGQGERR
jgi:CheY-like chemotaxis protein/HPt (histidine-containing phosphotransfer) domain-containing protein